MGAVAHFLEEKNGERIRCAIMAREKRLDELWNHQLISSNSVHNQVKGAITRQIFVYFLQAKRLSSSNLSKLIRAEKEK